MADKSNPTAGECASSAAISIRRRAFQRETWGIRLPALTGQPVARLVWFYHAGGSAASLLSVMSYMKSDWEIWIPEYPGHGSCWRSPLPQDFAELMARLSARIPSLGHEIPLLVFGHSMGALVAYEYVRALPEAVRASIRALVVSCMRAPAHYAHERRRERDLSDDELRNLLGAMELTASSLLDHPEFLRAILGLVRHDLRIMASYRSQNLRPMDVPIRMFNGIDDPLISVEDVEEWSRETCRPLGLQSFAGGHFYYAHDFASFASALNVLGEARYE